MISQGSKRNYGLSEKKSELSNVLVARIKKDVRKMSRLRHITGVCSKYGFAYLIEKANLPIKIPMPRHAREAQELPVEARTRKVLEELGPTFIKLGQMLSMRPDVIPYSFCREFEKLQDQVTPLPFAQILPILEKEYGSPPEQVFEDFNPHPIASASFAQVYEASLSGRPVVVKVRKPRVRETIESDLDLLYVLAQFFAEHNPALEEQYNFRKVVREFHSYIVKELDFLHETYNIERFRRMFGRDERVYFPETFRDKCTHEILVAERIEGLKVSRLRPGDLRQFDQHALAAHGAECILSQIFVHGVFHADPHPGNIFVLHDGKIGFVDIGIVGRLDEDTRMKLADVFLGVVQKDAAQMIDAFRELGTLEHVDEKGLRFALEDLLERYYDVPLEQFHMSEFLREIMRIISRYRIKMMPDFFLLMKSLVTIEGVGRRIDPGFRVIPYAKKFVERILAQKYSAARLARKVREMSRDTYKLVSRIPKDLAQISKKIKSGELQIQFEHRNLEKLTMMLDKVSNRISFALIIAALIIGSSIIIYSDQGPFLGEYPLLGIVGYLFAGILGLILLVTILRSGKL
ncbi:MAG: 2-polyprenylphenol 6-hydroxylase [Candidatus Omnitrophica bacterium]|nr:2-polyprenylphenol 6-hydroxylase [Candidatus Omnitrophota bacterium]